jgi:archaellum biogenesis ATPase FlaH
MFNKITKGGLPNKTLNIALAGTGVGKSLFMCHQAASCLMDGKNVLYITLEMSEERIAERIDANLFNVDIKSLMDLPKPMFDTKVQKVLKKTQGTLIIKEYPTASAHAGHFKSLLNELSLKKGFAPDIIFIDYLNICSSSRFKGTIVNSYTFIKAIAEELRGLAVEHNVPIVSATQTTRTGYCLDLKTQVQTPQGLKDISNIKVGDLVLSNAGYNEVLNVFPKTKKKSYKITLEDGKEIICSEEHLFPTENRELNIKGGLEEGMCLYVKE